MAKTPKFEPVRDAILKGIEKLKKWHSNVKENDAYFIALGETFFFRNLRVIDLYQSSSPRDQNQIL